MEKENFITNMAAHLSQNAHVKNVFGEPVRVGEKTIIPVAQIALGFGGGYGRQGKNKSRSPGKTLEDSLQSEENNGSEGTGGGGGMYAKPKGVYEITGNSTRFIPANRTKMLLIGVCLGWLLKGYMLKTRRKN